MSQLLSRLKRTDKQAEALDKLAQSYDPAAGFCITLTNGEGDDVKPAVVDLCITDPVIMSELLAVLRRGASDTRAIQLSMVKADFRDTAKYLGVSVDL